MNDDLTTNLREIQQQLGVDVAEKTIWKWLKDLGFTNKLVRPIYEERNTPEMKLERQNYVRLYFSKTLSFRLRNIIFIDESPFNLHIIRNHGCITMILAMNGHKIVNSEAIRGSVNAEVFNTFLTATTNVLGQAEEFIFLLDNINFHTHLLDNAQSMRRSICFNKIECSPKHSPSDTRDLISRMSDATCSVIPQHL
ncbi:hypothetical protein RF11_06891 [Thelohanellus kitauei]|uniref:Tc1-like transposase DDE domain-containing protein n=1 Tax=Thelohanellus kitauei TaxID=669202 RepID=A0A0C2IXP3_THEKT|nr:hypothetical protein RF11_06891 [Thelohanellus kitauei]